MPSLYYAGSTALERGSLFVSDPNGAVPPYFEGYTIEICGKNDTDCLSRCFTMSSSAHLSIFLPVLIALLFTLSVHIIF